MQLVWGNDNEIKEIFMFSCDFQPAALFIKFPIRVHHTERMSRLLFVIAGRSQIVIVLSRTDPLLFPLCYSYIFTNRLANVRRIWNG